jgi:hypothetical protein
MPCGNDTAGGAVGGGLAWPFCWPRFASAVSREPVSAGAAVGAGGATGCGLV